ncbi:hypothetical protein GCM10025298_31620 [Natronobiforma cellulositropha]
MLEWAETGGLEPGFNTPAGEEIRLARARSAAAGVEIDTASVQRSIPAQADHGPAGTTATPDVVRTVLSEPGHPLEGDVRAEMETRMGSTFGDVRLHTGPSAAAAASTLEARAFTAGNHVVFGRGEYDPESTEGKYLLAHELAHVRQQTGGQISMLPQEGSSLVIDPDPVLEREADETTTRAVSAEETVVATRLGTGIYIQRMMSALGVTFPKEQLQSKIKHGTDFGVAKNWSKKNGKRFQQALEDHINDSNTQQINGTYRGKNVTHYYNPTTGLVVIVKKNGEFLSGWKLSPDQEYYLTTSGSL